MAALKLSERKRSPSQDCFRGGGEEGTGHAVPTAAQSAPDDGGSCRRIIPERVWPPEPCSVCADGRSAAWSLPKSAVVLPAVWLLSTRRIGEQWGKPALWGEGEDATNLRKLENTRNLKKKSYTFLILQQFFLNSLLQAGYSCGNAPRQHIWLLWPKGFWTKQWEFCR